LKQHPYEEALKARVVRDFIAENSRTPNDLELRQVVQRADRRYPGLREVGFSGHLVTKPGFVSESSAHDENLNREAIHTDVDLTSERIDALVQRMETSFRSLYATGRNLKRRLDDIETRIDNVLLLSGSTDAFVHGIEENFVVQDKIDFVNTTASVESGFITMGRAGFGLVDLADVNISYTTLADKGTIGIQNASSIDSLKSDDGSFWDCLVYTNYKQGRVSLLIDVALDTPQFISEVRFTAQTGGSNSRNTATVFYSLDDKIYKTLEPQEIVLTTEENVFNVGLDGVRRIRIMISKDRYDNTTAVNSQFVYVFSLDSIKLYSKSYSADAESIVIAGPYDVLDEEGQPVMFTKATADVCVTQGEEDSVGLFLSTDGITYLPIDHTSNGLGIVSFTNGSSSGTETAITSTIAAAGLTEEAVVELRPTEALLNTAVDREWASEVVRKSIVVKRNVPYSISDTRAVVYGAASGWVYDSIRKMYRTTVYVSNEDGLVLDLGGTSAFVNSIQMSGQVELRQGYSVFETTESNWLGVPTNLTKLSDLRKADPLYPYNHRYLIEGYVYSDAFKGERVYAGVEEYFGSLLSFTSPELFASPESDGNLDIYTLDDSDGRLVFPVKVNKSDASWSLEQFEQTWLVSRGANNQLWFKMLLNSASGFTSPIVSSVRVRVV
jgi:hypothetical protein